MGNRVRDCLGFPRPYGLAIVCVLLLSGCALPSGGFTLFTGSITSEKGSSATQTDTCSTTEKCTAQLRRMVNDPKRDWVGQPQSPDVYADGTRLFAYRALRKKLSCSELKRALEETNAATPLLKPARYARVRALLTDVAHELNAEYSKRCRSHAWMRDAGRTKLLSRACPSATSHAFRAAADQARPAFNLLDDYFAQYA